MTSMIVETENNGCSQNKSLEPIKCRFDYPMEINNTGTFLTVREYILEYDGDEYLLYA